MKTKSFAQLLGVFAALTCFNTSCNAPAKEKPATAEELSQVNRDFAVALNTKDAEAAANCYAEDATLYPPNEPAVTGRANILKYWQGAIETGATNVSVKTIRTGSEGSLGWETGQFQMDIKTPDGKVVVDKGRYTELLKRNKDGKWVSIMGMWNADAPPAP
ncbi:MAG: nuclear transport factor 2 family protein [Dyadobacter sp.]|uniref:YybH family protein n=1 Tax=Dyadobacter sp. TaxID=1914288 RepID=UPI003266F12D